MIEVVNVEEQTMVTEQKRDRRTKNRSTNSENVDLSQFTSAQIINELRTRQRKLQTLQRRKEKIDQAIAMFGLRKRRKNAK